MQFAAAINRHDMQALTALMAPDIVLQFFLHPWQRSECRLVVRENRRELRERSDGGLQCRYREARSGPKGPRPDLARAYRLSNQVPTFELVDSENC